MKSSLLVIVSLFVAACGGGQGGDLEPGAGSSVLTAEQASEQPGPVTVQGFLWADGPEAVRLCDAALESFPPQCGEPSIPVSGIDITTVAGTDFFENIFWAESVRLIGVMDDGTLQAERLALASSANGLNARILVPPIIVQPNPGWTILMSNPGDEPVDIVFPSGQDADVLIRDAAGETLYAWSATFSFIQEVRTETLLPGETRRILLQGVPLEALPGSYELEATIAGEPGPGAMRGTIHIS
ncbi:MAG: hypothetical protein KJN81_12090 [Acidimicrobiia bacterium]|nr:hypothetical protein [Acidimicrobiia bacterium]NNL29160.1 hypothetical protein [Acidimicrobiia bacterium]